MLYVREIAEKFLSTLLLMFIPASYFRGTRRDAAAEKESDMAIQMTLKHVRAQTLKKWTRKARTDINITKRVNSSERKIYLRVYFNMKQTLRSFLSKK